MTSPESAARSASAFERKLLAADALADYIGYVGRPCGFDVDRDGVEGEPGDCVLGHDGVTDPDRDGIEELFLYVDCGTATSGDGTASRICLAIHPSS